MPVQPASRYLATSATSDTVVTGYPSAQTYFRAIDQPIADVLGGGTGRPPEHCATVDTFADLFIKLGNPIRGERGYRHDSRRERDGNPRSRPGGE